MNKLFTYLAFISLSLIVFASCQNGTEDLFPSELVKGAYIVGYGNYGEGGASISKYDYEENVFTNSYYLTQNEGFELLSNIQYAYEYKDSIYLLGNNTDQLLVVNPLFQQSMNGISEGIEKPRFCIADDNYLYISCWGASPDWSVMPDTYIAKFNVESQKVESKINLPGGPEGLTIVDGKLYAALNYVDSVAVINLEDDALSYIATPAVSSYFIKDENNNLYVTLLSTWSDFSTETGLGYINTANNVLEKTFPLAGVSTEYGSIISANSDLTKIYVLATQYDENWNLSGAVSVFDVASGTYAEMVSGISGPKGVSVNPNDDKVYLFTAENVTSGGQMKVYLPDGTLEQEFATGISPTMAIFLD